MKYSEFNQKIAELGFALEYQQNNVYVVNNHDIVAKVELHNRYMMSTHFITLSKITETIASELLMSCCMLSETPIFEREEEKRYYLRNVSPLLRGSGRGYLAKNKDTLEYYALSLKCSEEFYQTIFTESEIDQMDITGFEKIEVSND